MDMSQVIQPKSDQINSDDLVGGPRTVTITDVKIQGGTEQPVSMGIAGTDKVYRPCKSMSRVMVEAWGPDASKYVGRSLTLYRDPKVKWGGMEVGGIRISAMTDIPNEKVFMLTVSKANRAPLKVKVLERQQDAAPQTDPADLALARSEATRGMDSFRAWYQAQTSKRAANSIMDELQATAKAADAAIVDVPIDDDAPPI